MDLKLNRDQENKKDKKTSGVFWVIIFVIVIVIFYFIFFKSDGRALKVIKNTFDWDEDEESEEEEEEEEEEDVKGKSKKKKWKREEICREILESIYKIPFISVRPDFLKNPKYGRNLELDGYNKDVQIAFEHNGYQHYEYPNVWHKTEDEFIYQLEKDSLKKLRCKELRIHLIIIKYDIPENEIRSHIISEISKNPY